MASFIAELKRRNVFKVGVAYAIVAWLLTQIIVAIETPLNLPNWVDTLTIILLIIGFPITLVIAWAFELTPEGVKQSTFATDSESVKNKKDVKIQNKISADTKRSSDEKSIAVLPFANFSPDSDQEHFSDGLTEELINKLSQVKDLLVIGRTSAFYFKDRNEDMRKIGETLGVSYLLEGSVRKSGEKLRITAQLINATDGYHLWSQTYDRELADIFKVQDEITKEVTSTLSVALGVGFSSEPGSTRNIEAYNEVLRARSLEPSVDGISAAIDHYERAVHLDPSYGHGWFNLYQANVFAAKCVSPDKIDYFMKEANKALERARESAPNMPVLKHNEALELIQNGKWSEADNIYQKQLAQYGHSIHQVNMAYGIMLLKVGRVKEALKYFKRAVRMEPLHEDSTYGMLLTFIAMNQINEAIAVSKKNKALSEGKRNRIKWFAALAKGDLHIAAEAARANYNIQHDNDDLKIADLLETKETSTAITKIKNMAANPKNSHFAKTEIAHCSAVLGESELALNIIKDIKLKDWVWLPHFKEMRKLPGFKEYIYDVGILDFWRVTGKWSDFCHPIDDEDYECE